MNSLVDDEEENIIEGDLHSLSSSLMYHSISIVNASMTMMKSMWMKLYSFVHDISVALNYVAILHG